MSVLRIFIPPSALASGQEIVVPSEKARYLLTVMRVKCGDALVVTDGAGRAWDARVTSIRGKSVFLMLGKEVPAREEPEAPLVLCQGMLKGPKMDLVVQKATELGVSDIVPLITGFTVVRETRKTARWRKIAEEAAEQCGRMTLPRVHEPVALTQLLQTLTDGEGPSGLVFREREGMPLEEALDLVAPHGAAVRPIRLLVGPEGGLSEEEVHGARLRGFIPATLGRQTLRTETASIVAVALVGFLLGRRLSSGAPTAAPDLL